MNQNTTIISALVVLFFAVLAGFLVYHQPTSQPLPSTFSLSPTPSPQPTVAKEPDVASWTTYTNTDYNFTLSVPEDWKQQEYKLPSGVFIVAFAPSALPCATCTYVHEGYLSVKIFNQKSDPQAYKTFTESLQSIGKVKGYFPAQLNNVKGVLYANTVEVENHGLVYQVTLDENNGTMDALSSQIFQKSASSLTFTYLLFGQ